MFDSFQIPDGSGATKASSDTGTLAEGGKRLRSGKVKTAALLWLLGIPIPLILLILLVRSCM